MASNDLLFEVFLKHGLEQKLDEELLKKTYEHLSKFQFLPAGERKHVRNTLLNILKSNVK